ncbi:hypothetical protein BDZ94DRAFT_1321611 [Collybia nuda]|uniref:Uncharacterized protein n=1 Tax=Collybia nuda TaxID=64659 RepID=A0A9P6CKD2_9AGAR|nr:hypothetical protein BDZ94DRAFT_1321611 [Collybia nuda]
MPSIPYKPFLTKASGRDCLKPSSLSTGGERRTTRKDRAIIRILIKHGLSCFSVAQRVGFSQKTVGNVLKKRIGGFVNDDESQDYKFVKESFITKYPPLPPANSSAQCTKRGKKPKFDVVDADTGGPPLKQTTDTSVSQSLSISHPQLQDVTQKSHSKGSKDNPIEVDSTPPEGAENMNQSIMDFLLNLDHDLSSIYHALKSQDLGTLEKLFAIAVWPEETLHQLFKEALPLTSITQRLILVKGMKDCIMGE